METFQPIPTELRRSGAALTSWRILSTPPMSGEDNMRFDRAMLEDVRQHQEPPTLRLFRFSKPTVSYGRLQKLQNIQSLIPEGWLAVQRPTGGGIVFHKNDLCFSLCWPRGQAPLPLKPQDQYRWIHSIALEAMDSDIRMAACCDIKPAESPFEIRACFTHPVGYDLMNKDQKVVGGALSCHREATLYQGSIQLSSSEIERKIQAAFERHLNRT